MANSFFQKFIERLEQQCTRQQFRRHMWGSGVLIVVTLGLYAAIRLWIQPSPELDALTMAIGMGAGLLAMVVHFCVTEKQK